MEQVCVFWFRRDLRLEDNTGLSKALQSGLKVLPLFIFDKNILEKLQDPADKRVQFIHQEVKALKNELEEKVGSSLLVRYGKPLEIWQDLLEEYDVKLVVANRDYEPYAVQRDKALYELLQDKSIDFKGYKDQVLLDRNEVLKKDGKPYTVFTPYMRQYKSVLQQADFEEQPVAEYADNFLSVDPLPLLSLEEIGFKSEPFEFPSREFDEELIAGYDKTRDFPGIKGTSRLSLHLRFGTISIRRLAYLAQQLNETFFNELIWRDFYQNIIYHFPESANDSFKPKYEAIEWRNNEEEFEKWCQGKTGYPLVDAGMRELNTTGFMHNRIRMLVASFLTKHLLIDWRWGEAYFAEKLLDYECASNVGGWQWAAGSGVDAQPYFRIFNPELQLKKFDKELQYVKHFVPEYGTKKYPAPMVNHKEARQRALDTFKKAVG